MSDSPKQPESHHPASGRLFMSKVAALSDEEHGAAAKSAKRVQPGQEVDPVTPVSEAEEKLWKEYTASFRRRNNKIG